MESSCLLVSAAEAACHRKLDDKLSVPSIVAPRLDTDRRVLGFVIAASRYLIRLGCARTHTPYYVWMRLKNEDSDKKPKKRRRCQLQQSRQWSGEVQECVCVCSRVEVARVFANRVFLNTNMCTAIVLTFEKQYFFIPFVYHLENHSNPYLDLFRTFPLLKC